MSFADLTSALKTLALIPLPTASVITAGSTVRDHEGNIGTVKFIGVSPYWAEEIHGIERAYVVYAGSTDYALEGEISLVK